MPISGTRVLREIRTARFERRLTLFGWRYDLCVGKRKAPKSCSTSLFQTVQRGQRTQPQRLGIIAGKAYWLFEDHFYSDDEDLTQDDVLALVRDRERRKQRRLERARAGLAADGTETTRREPIPREVRLAVFERDGGHCVECGSNFDIQYDHIIPFSMGGASTAGNLQILCATCNQRKGATI